jgi:hypothetical protein
MCLAVGFPILAFYLPVLKIIHSRAHLSKVNGGTQGDRQPQRTFGANKP